MVNVEEKYRKFIEAEYDYLQCLRDEYSPKFQEWQSKRTINIHHSLYPYISNSSNGNRKKELDENEKDELHRVYKALAMKYHPDKCKDPDANTAFARIQNAYSEGDLEFLKNFTMTTEGKQEKEEKEKKRSIDVWKSELWYYWYTKNPLIEGLFVTEEEKIEKEKKYNEFVEKLKMENEQIAASNKILMDQINELNKIYSRQ